MCALMWAIYVGNLDDSPRLLHRMQGHLQHAPILSARHATSVTMMTTPATPCVYGRVQEQHALQSSQAQTAAHWTAPLSQALAQLVGCAKRYEQQGNVCYMFEMQC